MPPLAEFKIGLGVLLVNGDIFCAGFWGLDDWTERGRLVCECFKLYRCFEAVPGPKGDETRRSIRKKIEYLGTHNVITSSFPKLLLFTFRQCSE